MLKHKKSTNIKTLQFKEQQQQQQQQQSLFYGHYTGQSALATAPPVENWKLLLVQSFTARMHLLTATSAFGLGRRRWSTPQQCSTYSLYHNNSKKVNIIYKHAQRSTKAKLEAAENGAKWTGRRGRQSGSFSSEDKISR